MRKLISLMAALSLISTLFAQSGSISGTITDDKGNGLAGANVTVEGTSLGAAAATDGSYSISSVPPGRYTVTASYIGYESASQTASVGNDATTVNFSLQVSALAGRTVSVIGSRFAHTEEEQAVPVDVFTAQEIRRVGFTETGQILQALAPSFNLPKTTISDGSDTVRPMTLRGLSSGQVLVLVNGKRRHTTALVHVNSSPSRGDTGVDLNAIPAAAIKRIEVLRDGAAAQYGSDAIAGVINIILKDESDGGTFQVYAGQNSHTIKAIPSSYNLYDWAGNGERMEWNPTGYVDINSNFTPGSEAHVTDSKDYTINDGRRLQVQYSNSFKLGDDGYLMVAAEYRDRTASNRVGFQAGRLYEINSDYWSNDEAETMRLQPGSNWYINPKRMIWGNQAQKNFGTMFNASVPQGEKRFYAFGGYVVRKADTGCYTRKPNQANKTWLSKNPTGYVPHIQPLVTDKSISGGVEGIMNDWSYDLSSTLGSNEFHFFMNSTNASFGPEVPREYDIGGFNFTQWTNNIDATTQMGDIDLAVGGEFRMEKYRIFAGEPQSYLNGQAGTNVAGWDSVDEEGNQVGVNSSTAGTGCQCFSGFKPSNEEKSYDANRTSFGAYADAEYNMSDALRFGGAARFENYSDFGSTFNVKATTRYALSEALIFRGGFSTGFRAPALAQAYQSKVATNFTTDPTTGEAVAYEVGNFPVSDPFPQALGAEELKPEKSVNISAGASYTTGAVKVNFDFYDVTIKDRIVMTGNFQSGSSELGQMVEKLLKEAGVPGKAAGRFFFNGVDTHTQGIDIAASYDMKLANIGDLTLSFSHSQLLANEVTAIRTPSGIENSTLSEEAKEDARYGMFNGQEERTMTRTQPWQNTHFRANLHRGNWNFNYHLWRVGSTLSRGFDSDYETDSRVSGMKETGNWEKYTTIGGVDEWAQVFAAKIVMDVKASYDLGSLTFTGGINNLLDTMPDKGNQPGSGNNGAFVYSGLTPIGMNGRFMYLSTTFNF